MKKIFISVISHGHESIIRSLDCLAKLSKLPNVIIVLKNNKPTKNEKLKPYCLKNNIHYLDRNTGLGFGENNNFIFNYCEHHLQMVDEDYFLILNPDVNLDKDVLSNMFGKVQLDKVRLSTLNLFKDKEYTIPDNCVRKFPGALNFISSFIGRHNSSIIDKTLFTTPQYFDWAAGSFLLFESSLYQTLRGFDKAYFMYCEDIDICWRAKNIQNECLMFYPEFKAIHLAQHANRSVFSKHFLWHLKSILRYLMMFYRIRKIKIT